MSYQRAKIDCKKKCFFNHFFDVLNIFEKKSAMNKIASPFTLPNGSILKNRIAKSAMSENNADKGGKPSERIIKLYKTWGEGGTGILISGNVMMDTIKIPKALNV